MPRRHMERNLKVKSMNEENNFENYAWGSKKNVFNVFETLYIILLKS